MNNPEQMHLVTNSTSTETEKSGERRRDSKEDAYRPTMAQFWYNVIIVCLILIILVLFAVILAAMFAGKAGGVGMDHVDICETRQCLELASKMKSYQNLSVDPCDDFFEHACGRYHEHQSRDTSALAQQQQVLESLVFATVRKTTKFASNSTEKLRIFAKKCADRESMNADTFDELWTDIDRRGGFPFIDPSWDERKFDLSEMLSNYIRINRNRLGFLAVEPYTVRGGENRQKIDNRLFVSPGPHWVYKRAMPMNNFKNGIAFVISRLLKLRNETLDEAEFDREFEKLVDLENEFSELADFRYTPADRGNISLIRPLSDLEKSIPEIDWRRILRAIPDEKWQKPEEMDEFLRKVDVMDGNYFFGSERKLARLANETDPSTLANYLVFRQLLDVSLHFYDQDQPKQAKFCGHPDRASFCAHQMVDFFPMPAMNVLREQTHLADDNLRAARSIFSEIRHVYREMFEKSEVFADAAVRAAAIRKLDGMTANFGYPEYFDGEPLLEKMYETLDFLESDTPWQVYMKMWRHRTEQVAEHIVHNTPLNPVQMRVGSFNAGYRAYHNHLNVQLPLLTYPCIDPNYPKHVVYGCIGVIIGHEIGHAFDNFHRVLDENGRPTDLWTRHPSSNSAYEKIEQCLIDQYSHYKEPGFDFYMNGTHPRLELFADHFGIQAAYRAFQKVRKVDSYKLAGMNGFTKEQMFFYRQAMHYCDVLDPNRHPQTLIHQTHPVNRYRVNGNFQNIREFADAFKCADDTPMNPKKKCKLF